MSQKDLDQLTKLARKCSAEKSMLLEKPRCDYIRYGLCLRYVCRPGECDRKVNDYQCVEKCHPKHDKCLTEHPTISMAMKIQDYVENFNRQSNPTEANLSSKENPNRPEVGKSSENKSSGNKFVQSVKKFFGKGPKL